MTTSNINTIPAYYDPTQVGRLYLPDMARSAAHGQALNLAPASQDKHRVMLLLVDCQIDFIFQEGTLSVPGAIADTQRTIEWIYRHTGELTNISASLDSHTTYQIFYPTWWVNEKGEHPAPYTPITTEDIRKGVWRPLVDPAWSLQYVEKLEKGGRYALMIWPYHTMIGTPGQSLVPALSEAIMYHAAARHAQPTWLLKGSIPQTENYSILEPEVKVPTHPLGGLNTAFLDMLGKYDLVYVAGQAKSHCVLSTMRSIIEYFDNQPEVIKKLRFLMDCTSSVAHPAIDFDAIANAELAQMSRKGMALVKSTDPLG
ncbi:MAG TPA: cysteine hydrolase family protein [Chloroflexia bacterium]|nr:cysteine hydrolase family protein [Chloroflexia bacterium]